MPSQCAVGEKGGGSLHSNLLHSDSSAVAPSQKKRGRANQVCFPVANTSTGSPKGDPWHCQFCTDILVMGKKVFLTFIKRRDRCWSEPHHMVVGKAEKRGRDVEQVGGKKPIGLDSTFSLSLPPRSTVVQLCSVS